MSVIERWQTFLNKEFEKVEKFTKNQLSYGRGFARNAAPSRYFRGVGAYLLLWLYIVLFSICIR